MKKIKSYKGLFKFKNLNGRIFLNIFRVELKTCATVGIVEYHWRPRTEYGQVINNRFCQFMLADLGKNGNSSVKKCQVKDIII